MNTNQVPLLFITGASSGIGQALALRYFQAGYQLALVARRTQAVQEWAEQAREVLSRLGQILASAKGNHAGFAEEMEAMKLFCVVHGEMEAVEAFGG